MLIVCSSCASEYMIDPGRLGSNGRTVRCASCKSTWFVAPETEEPGAAPGSEKAPSTIDNEGGGEWDDASFSAPTDASDKDSKPSAGIETESNTFGQATGRGGREHSRGFAQRSRQAATTPLLILAGLVIAGSAFWGRAQMVRTFPATAALYAGIGLPVNLRGLEFRAVRSELVAAGADTFLVVEGEIANISGRDAAVPPIEIGLRGAEGQMLYTWTNDPPRETMAMSDTARFRARLAAPPADARQVLVRFAAGREGAAVASHMHEAPGR